MADQGVWEFGRVENPEEDLPDLTPIEFKLYGYEREAPHTEHEFTFHLNATEPLGEIMDVYRTMDAAGIIQVGPAARFIYGCLLEEDRELWAEVVHKGELHFQAEVIAQMAEKLVAQYSGKEATLPRSERRATQRHTGRTSTAAHSGKESGSASSQRPTATTSSGA